MRGRMLRAATAVILLGAAGLAACATSGEGPRNGGKAADRSAGGGSTAVVVKSAGRPVHPSELSFERLEVDVPRPERFTLDNGMVVHYLPDRELPLVELTFWFPAAGVYEPADKTGLAAYTAAWVRNGGAGGRNRAEVDLALEFLAAEISVAIDDEHGEARLSVLRKDLDEGLSILAALFRSPEFDPAVEGLLKQSFLRNVLAQTNSPAGVLGREFPGVMYGGHPYGRVPTVTSIQAITREDCIAFWERFAAPNRMIVGAAGDLSRDELAAALTTAFGDWEATAPEPPPVDPVEADFTAEVVVIPREESQSHVRMGTFAVKRTDPDRIPLDVMNLILGGAGFSSRLTEVVRVREGLAYDVGSGVTRKQDLGLFLAVVQTKGETTWKAISLILDEIRKIREEPVPEDELARAKDMVLNGLVFSYSEPFSVVDSAVSLEYFGYPPDFLEKWPSMIEAVTQADVMRVARKYLRPDAMKIVIAGDPDIFDAPPAGLPEPTVLDPAADGR